MDEQRQDDQLEPTYGVMVKATDCGIVVSEFEFQPRYYVHFKTNDLILQAMG